MRKCGYPVFACSILPDHVHMVIGRLPHDVEQAAARLLKQAASIQLETDGLHPFLRYRDPLGKLPTPWGKGCWKVFLDLGAATSNGRFDTSRIIPWKEGKSRQTWSFVTRYA